MGGEEAGLGLLSITMPERRRGGEKCADVLALGDVVKEEEEAWGGEVGWWW